MRLSSMFRVPLTKKIGKYLGHYVLHRGRNGSVCVIIWKDGRLSVCPEL